jgi:peptide deformylase
MNIVERENPILTTPCQKFDFMEPPMDPIELAQDMVRFMYEKNAFGLSANQIGIPYRVFSMRGHPENFVCFNPRIVQPSEETITLEEGCLTFPGLLVKVKRPRHVRVRFQLPNGDTKTETYTGMTARVFQQQLDFLDGMLYYNRANKYHKEIAFKKWKKPSEHILSRP